MIFVDNRAGSVALVNHAPLDNTSVAQLARLDSADAMFVGNGPTGNLLVGVEVKRIDELISAQQTGRLTTQVERMLDTYGRNYLAYYGNINADDDDNVVYNLDSLCNVSEFIDEIIDLAQSGYEEVVMEDVIAGLEELKLQVSNSGWVYASFGAPIDGDVGRKVPFAYLFNLLSDLDESGIRCVHCATYADVATYISRLHRAWSKPWAARTYLRTVDNSQPQPLIPRYAADKYEHERIKLFVAVASHLPGTGYTRALAVAKHFPSMRALFNASVMEIMSVDGIGKTGAKRLHAAMNATRRRNT